MLWSFLCQTKFWISNFMQLKELRPPLKGKKASQSCNGSDIFLLALARIPCCSPWLFFLFISLGSDLLLLASASIPIIWLRANPKGPYPLQLLQCSRQKWPSSSKQGNRVSYIIRLQKLVPHRELEKSPPRRPSVSMSVRASMRPFASIGCEIVQISVLTSRLLVRFFVFRLNCRLKGLRLVL